MATQRKSTQNAPSSDEYLWSIERYHSAIERGTFTEADKLELIEGKLYQKMGSNPPHATCLTHLNFFFYKNYLSAYTIRSENPITLPTLSEPEPDLVLAKLPTQNYAKRHPYPADIVLVVEVADATLQKDRTIKLPTYAKAGLPEYWIVNLVDRQLEIYTQPRPDGTYAKAAFHAAGTLAESPLTGEVAVDQFLP